MRILAQRFVIYLYDMTSMFFFSEGNLSDVIRAGSLHEYLLHLHDEYGKICGFYWGEQFVVSVADPKYFDQQVGVFDRPSEFFCISSPYFCYKY